jgi:hypothetical protein
MTGLLIFRRLFGSDLVCTLQVAVCGAKVNCKAVNPLHEPAACISRESRRAQSQPCFSVSAPVNRDQPNPNPWISPPAIDKGSQSQQPPHLNPTIHSSTFPIHCLIAYLRSAKKHFAMTITRLLTVCVAAIALAGGAAAHGGGGAHQKPIEVAADADWATRHMAGKFSSIPSIWPC